MSIRRREFLKASAYAAATSTVIGPVLAKAIAAESAIDLKIAGYSLEHLTGLMTGKVQITGCNVEYEVGKIGDLTDPRIPATAVQAQEYLRSRRRRHRSSRSTEGQARRHARVLVYVAHLDSRHAPG